MLEANKQIKSFIYVWM